MLEPIDFSPKQSEALSACQKFLDDPDRQLFVLTGFAGTGKTTLAKYLAHDIHGMVLFAAYTARRHTSYMSRVVRVPVRCTALCICLPTNASSGSETWRSSLRA